ncbi:hypothetical protein MMC07_005341 [Pseudocyphellaria aurata]|nr:hypothetical protein [Pseudocyphellaria aurata]
MNIESPATTSRSSSATLRPRNRRLNSQESDLTSVKDTFSTKISLLEASSISSGTPSRAVSPIPGKHPSRPAPSNRNEQTQQVSINPSKYSNLLGSQTSPSTFAAGLWETSWSSLQGIASNLLSGDSLGPSSRNQSPRRKRRSPEVTQTPKSAVPAQWGPPASGESKVGLGSREDRRAQVQAKKREALLAANGYLAPDASGRYKRRDSEESGATSAPPGDADDRDALVYIHEVKPSDTHAGVMIKYNCQPNAFRKANRLWPNDSIQVRKTLVLPVDACGVKGRKLADTDGPPNHLKSQTSQDSMRTPTNSHHSWYGSAQSSEPKESHLSNRPISPSLSVLNPEESAWKHDSWVMIDGFPDAVEIARLSRRNLGFFPPSRRKSISLSDHDTPSRSLELSRERRHDQSPRRKESRSSSGSHHFVHQLQGPGGVGTLGRKVHNPGPAQDGLNKLFSSHLPNLAPRTSFESTTSTSSAGIENVGGAIEGWVRKLAIKAAASVQSPAPGGRSGIGDLIELTDAFEPGDDNDDRGGTKEHLSVKPLVGTWQDEQERILREHFPPRGRMFGESKRRNGD